MPAEQKCVNHAHSSLFIQFFLIVLRLVYTFRRCQACSQAATLEPPQPDKSNNNNNGRVPESHQSTQNGSFFPSGNHYLFPKKSIPWTLSRDRITPRRATSFHFSPPPIVSRVARSPTSNSTTRPTTTSSSLAVLFPHHLSEQELLLLLLLLLKAHTHDPFTLPPFLFLRCCRCNIFPFLHLV